MDVINKRLVRAGLIFGFLLVLFGFVFAGLTIKVRVTVDKAPVKAAPAIGGQTLTTVPLESVLDAEPKQGQFYKVYVTKAGVKIAGYIHAMLVEEITENEAQQTLSSSGRVRSQAEIVAEIEIKMDEDKKLIRQENEPDKALSDLMPLIAKSFNIDDRQKQKQIACELYFWIGQACRKKDDNYGALKEFKNMFDVDYAYAKEITKNISDPLDSGLIEHAEKLSKGLLVEYNLQITTKPKEAVLKINGKSVGMSPDVYRSTVPKFTLEVEKEGYRPIKEELFLMQAMTVKDYTLESLGRNLVVSSVPNGAQVFVDGKNTGKLTDYELPFVPYGSHAVKLVRDNYADWDATALIPEGSTGPVSLSATLIVNTYVFFQKNGGPELKFFKQPKALAFDKDGNFYVLDESDVKVKKFDAESRFQASWGDAGRESRALKVPAGAAVDGAGNVYITDSKACSVLKFDKTGKFLKRWGEAGPNPNELSGPTGIAIDAAGDVYVADTYNNRIVKYSKEGVLKKTWGKQGTLTGEFVLPTALTVGAKNEVIVIDRSRVQKFGPEGEPLGVWGKSGSGNGEFKAPMGVCTDSFDHVYIADTGNNRLLKFDPTGKLVCQWGVPGSGDGQMTAPFGIAVNGKGNVFVVERDNQRFQEFRIPAK
ncbi:MAG: PEGA domain-containing protein [Candidatus Aminicenantes bacterium]|nr:PEGA domain-containing protein [Candidatus Aminicenantes bacterium]